MTTDEPASDEDRRAERPGFQARARLALALALVLIGLWTVKAFLPALVWAAILVIATWPLYRRARARWPAGRHDLVLPALFTTAVALVVLVPLGIAGVEIAREARILYAAMEEARRHGIAVPAWLPGLPAIGGQAAAWWRDTLADPAGYSEFLGRLNHGSLYGYTRQLGGQLVHRSVVFGFTLLALFFLYRDGERLAGQMLAASHRAFGPHGERIGRQAIASVHGTVDGLVLVGLGEGFLMWIAYLLAGLPHPTLFGAATAIAAMIPFGAPVVFCVAGILLLAAGSATAAAAVVAFGFVVVFVADHFVRPVLIGGATRLPFLWVLLGILGGVETWGLLGLFLGPAIMAALVLLWRDWIAGALRSEPAETADDPPFLVRDRLHGEP
ncbi:AI-2E family transporter [Enterovirga aerilata]|uniref:AI-2E family transporter n=1 Tax=Enterovirga aerilata TaxID=2730920 RepID=A0A849I9J8_9HYPH|nr:AI-2E family transporter [Enterovirga sp. DB1703]NNM73981.1 AI-2E family transporter [Enterovirga sp. DB1703]